ncbi:hypothetical protein [Paraburkholderia ultramafica]|nr:hypothetical protein [Paraburkholderia ultramafica]
MKAKFFAPLGALAAAMAAEHASAAIALPDVGTNRTHRRTQSQPMRFAHWSLKISPFELLVTHTGLF